MDVLNGGDIVPKKIGSCGQQKSQVLQWFLFLWDLIAPDKILFLSNAMRMEREIRKKYVQKVSLGGMIFFKKGWKTPLELSSHYLIGSKETLENHEYVSLEWSLFLSHS